MIGVLQDMESDHIQPDEQTLYLVMSLINKSAAMCGIRSYKQATKTALAFLAEFRHAGVEPSLGTYGQLIDLCFMFKQKSHIVLDIVSELEKRQNSGMPIRAVIADDFEFFRIAMKMSGNIHLNNLNLAYRLHRIIVKEGDKGTALLGTYASMNEYYR